jgi:hypothetical protein
VVTDPHPLAEQGARPLPGREDPVVADLAAALGPSSREGLSLPQLRRRAGPGPFAWNKILGEQKAVNRRRARQEADAAFTAVLFL